MSQRNGLAWLTAFSQISAANSLQELAAIERHRLQAEQEQDAANRRRLEAQLFDKVQTAFERFMQEDQVDLRLDSGIAESDRLLSLSWDVKISDLDESLLHFQIWGEKYAELRGYTEGALRMTSSLSSVKLPRRARLRYESVLERMQDFITKSAAAVACLQVERVLLDDELAHRTDAVIADVREFLSNETSYGPVYAVPKSTQILADLSALIGVLDAQVAKLHCNRSSVRVKSMLHDIENPIRSLRNAEAQIRRSRFGVPSPFSAWAAIFGLAGVASLGALSPIALLLGVRALASRRRRRRWMAVLGALTGATGVAFLAIAHPWNWIIQRL